MRVRVFRPLIVLSVLILTLALAPASFASKPFPEIIPLPDGFAPEGIAIGNGTTFFVGSIPTGAIYRGDLRTGQGALLVPPTDGRQAIGLAVDKAGKRLFVAGGPTGQAYVYDTSSGALLKQYQLTAPGTFVNDVVVTRDAAYFTNSFQPVIYRIALGPGGQPGDAFETIPVGGDFESGPGFNLNGIDATPNGKQLIVVNSALGRLYLVDPVTGVASEIDLGGETVERGDGILLDGKTLYVVQNVFNQIAVIKLSADLTQGVVVERVTNTAFRVPTTIAEHGNRLYAVNARFGTPVEPGTDYDVVQIRKP
jgi:DNA-binding beta-propeller fold protein YncE